jgi:glutathione S-transferase
MLTLYQAEWCPYCHRVRQVLTELELTYTCVNVPLRHDQRERVREVSGQEAVPVLKDGRKVVVGSDAIMAHLRAAYAPPADADDHAEVGRFRLVLRFDETTEEVLALLRDALAAADFRILAETRGFELGLESLPDDYVLVQVALPSAVEQAVAIDPTIPAAASFSLAVFPYEAGSAIAVIRPFAEAWVYGDAVLSELTRAVTQRLYEALERL